VLGLAAPVADVRRLTELLGERLNAIVLPEPVRACELRSSSLVKRVLTSNSVWQPGEHGGSAGAEAPELIERLRARLGPEAVYGLQVLPGHRPENAWARSHIQGPSAGHGWRAGLRLQGRYDEEAPVPWPAFRRPLWLLPIPKLLSERDGLPRRRGPLRLVSEPERIETGWWDGGDIARDYYTAIDLHGVRLWIFRERVAPHRWFLHGVYG
jgi:protein ImuB